MTNRHGQWLHPFMYTPRAGEREIRMRPLKEALIVRGKGG